MGSSCSSLPMDGPSSRSVGQSNRKEPCSMTSEGSTNASSLERRLTSLSQGTNDDDETTTPSQSESQRWQHIRVCVLVTPDDMSFSSSTVAGSYSPPYTRNDNSLSSHLPQVHLPNFISSLDVLQLPSVNPQAIPLEEIDGELFVDVVSPDSVLSECEQWRNIRVKVLSCDERAEANVATTNDPSASDTFHLVSISATPTSNVSTSSRRQINSWADGSASRSQTRQPMVCFTPTVVVFNEEPLPPHSTPIDSIALFSREEVKLYDLAVALLELSAAEEDSISSLAVASEMCWDDNNCSTFELLESNGVEMRLSDWHPCHPPLSRPTPLAQDGCNAAITTIVHRSTNTFETEPLREHSKRCLPRRAYRGK